MVKPAALLLLLAVAAIQVDLIPASVLGPRLENITDCPLNFYGRNYRLLSIVLLNDTVKICFINEASEPLQDCAVISDGLGASNFTLMISQTKTLPGSGFHRLFPVIANITSPCFIVLLVQRIGFTPLPVRFYDFVVKTLIAVGPKPVSASVIYSLKTTVGNSTVRTWNFTALPNTWHLMDFGGCRFAGIGMRANSKRLLPEKCSLVVCDKLAVNGRVVNKCGPLKVCRNNTCSKPIMCTVTGFTVIDFYSRVRSVTDRCVYSLMKSQGSSQFELLAGFRERRRQDVMFLDHLILWLSEPGVKISLEQGGRVKVNDSLLALNTTAQLVHGVELSKDQRGVTANLPFANTTVFFDGNTAHVAGFEPVPPVEGLCGSSDSNQTTTLRAVKASSYSAAGCEVQYNDTVDPTVNCTRSTERCNLMNQTSFAGCHGLIDPQSFITACNNTMCKYPVVDGVNCQFFEAYAKMCRLIHNITLEDWRSTTNCSAVQDAPLVLDQWSVLDSLLSTAGPQASCLDQYCSTHEFCGKNLGGTRCFCRARFASKYKPTNALGEPTVCDQDSASLTLAACLLEDKNINYTLLQLSDQNCTGHMDQQTHMVTFSFNSSNTCGAEVLKNNSQVVYKNTVIMRNISTGIIARHNQVVIDFSCLYAVPENQTASFRIKDSSVVQQMVSGVWNYTLMMNAYNDSGRTNLIGPTTVVRLNQKIWMELKTEGLDGNTVALVTDFCWATNQPSPDASVRYELIINGCPNPADRTVTVEGNGAGTSNFFSFNMFQFSRSNSEIYLHCSLELCHKQDNTCAQNCGGGSDRKRRSSRFKRAGGSPALITMVCTN